MPSTNPATHKLIDTITDVLNEAHLRFLWSKKDLDIQAVCGTFLQTFKDTLKTLLQRQERDHGEINVIMEQIMLEPEPERFGSLRPANFFTAVLLFCLQTGKQIPVPQDVGYAYDCPEGRLSMNLTTKELTIVIKQPAHSIHLSFELGKDGTVYSPDSVV